MPPQLTALTEGPNILLDKPILLLGRHQECDIQLNSRKVSRRHCCIAQVQDYLVVRDLGSTNGIRINGVRVQEGNLHPGDELTIGSHRYQLNWSADSQSNAPRAAPNQPAEGKVVEFTGRMDNAALESRDEPFPLPEEDKDMPPSVVDDSSERSEATPAANGDPQGDSASMSDILPPPPAKPT
jgi:pSer/pThr/pTyr-binding forkhead associated (FHA) protein